jgi:hypothetical protein
VPLLVSTFVALLLSLAVAPTASQAGIVPCDPLYNCPFDDPPPPNWSAVGRDEDWDDAYDEAAQQASNSCPGHSYRFVRLLSDQVGDEWKLTLIYHCT